MDGGFRGPPEETISKMKRAAEGSNPCQNLSLAFLKTVEGAGGRRIEILDKGV